MAKSSRASSVKKNNQRLKKHVFGPVETARNDRLSAKLLELASQPKPPRTEMEIEQNSMPTPEHTTSERGEERMADKNAVAAEQDGHVLDRKVDTAADEDVDMDADDASKSRARNNNTSKKPKGPKSPRVEKKRPRKAKNSIVFPMRHTKSKKMKKR